MFKVAQQINLTLLFEVFQSWLLFNLGYFFPETENTSSRLDLLFSEGWV